MNELKTIETVYNGYRFRSRLEARWAVFFDTLGIKYEYEKEGFELGAAGRYLPDFWLPHPQVWVEVKANELNEAERAKAEALVRSTGFPLTCCIGTPEPNAYEQIQISAMVHKRADWFALIKKELDEARIAIAADGGFNGTVCFKDTSERHTSDIPPSIRFTMQMFKTEFIASINHGYNPPLPLETIRVLFNGEVGAACDAAKQARFEHGETPKIKVVGT